MGGSGASSKGRATGSGTSRPIAYEETDWNVLPRREYGPDTAENLKERSALVYAGILDYEYKGVVMRKVVDQEKMAIRSIGPLYADQEEFLVKHGYRATFSQKNAHAMIDAALKKAADARKRKKAT